MTSPNIKICRDKLRIKSSKIKTPPPSDEYREGHVRTFGKCAVCGLKFGEEGFVCWGAEEYAHIPCFEAERKRKRGK